MVNEKNIQALLKQHFEYSGVVTIDPQGQVSVAGDVWLKRNSVIPPEIKFLHVGGGFWCNNTSITSLEGAPSGVGGDFWCNNTSITSLEGAPKSVGGYFDCGDTKITSLVGAPKSVGRYFDCRDTEITSLVGLPKTIGKRIVLTYSPNLPILRALVARQGLQFWSKGIPQTGDAEKVAEIINQYAGQGNRVIFKCKKELIEAGFEGNARW